MVRTVENENVFSLQDYLAVLRRQKGLIVAVAVLAAVGGAVWFLLKTPMYEAHADLTLERVRAAQDVSLNELLNPSGNVRSQDVAGATSLEVAEEAVEVLGRGDPAELQQQVRAEAVSEDRVLRITATDEDPVTAARIADAFAMSFIEFRRQAAIDTVLLTQEELDQRASEIRAEIAAVDAQIAGLNVPATDDEAAEELTDDAAADPADDAAADPADDAAAQDDQDAAADDAEIDEDELLVEELDELETLQIRRNALRTQLAQVIARSTELGESADALTGFAADFNEARVPSTPVGNTIFEVVGVAFILGLALGIGLAFVRDHFDDVIRDEEGLKRASQGLPVLGRIPIWKPAKGGAERVASIVEPTSAVAEAYRELSAGVRFLLVAQDDDSEYVAGARHGLSHSRVIMVTSANMGEGKTATAANLAVAAARFGLKVVLVDADLRRPAIARRFGLPRSTGLSDALLNGEPASNHASDVGIDNLRILTAGTTPPNPAELLASPAMRALEGGLLKEADLVIYDTPAVLAVPDALEIGPFMDMAIMLGRVGSTGRRRLSIAIERLTQVGTRVSGTVLNGIDPSSDGYYYAYQYVEEAATDGGRSTRRTGRNGTGGAGNEATSRKHRSKAFTSRTAGPGSSAGYGATRENWVPSERTPETTGEGKLFGGESVRRKG